MVLETGYRPRCPEQSPLYAAVAGHLEEFLARQRERDRDLPGFVETEFPELLECGVLAFGFGPCPLRWVRPGSRGAVFL